MLVTFAVLSMLPGNTYKYIKNESIIYITIDNDLSAMVDCTPALLCSARVLQLQK